MTRIATREAPRAGRRFTPSARFRRPRRVPNRLGIVLAAFAGVLLLTSILAAALVVRGAPALERRVAADLQAGQAELTNSKALLAAGAQKSNLQDIANARHHIAAARRDFQQARGELDWSGSLLAAHLTPVGADFLRPRVDSAAGITNLGLALCDALDQVADIDQVMVDPKGAPGTGAAKLLAAIKVIEPKSKVLVDRLNTAKAELSSVDPTVLSAAQRSALKTASEQLKTALTDAQNLRDFLPVLLEILGAAGPRSYLIEQVNPAELRAGGGFIGSYTLLSAERGIVKIAKSGGIESVDYPRPFSGEAGYVAPPATLMEFIGNKSWVLGDSNFFPDFPTSARWAETFSKKELGVKPDGVISLDPTAIAAVLNVTGPIQIPAYNVTVSGATFAEDVFQREAPSSVNYTEKKKFLSAVAAPLVERVTALPASRWPALITALGDATRTRHLQVYFDSHAAQKQMVAYGWSGTVNPRSGGDFMMEVESNFGATKANHFIQRSYDVQLSVVNQQLVHHMTVTLKNTTPPGLEGGRHYRTYVRLYVPGEATGISTSGLKTDDYPNTDAPAGLRLIDGWTQVNVDWRTGLGVMQLGFQYSTPWHADDKGQHSIYWQKQPGTESDAIHVTWSESGHAYSAAGDLGQDRSIVLTSAGVSIAPAEAGSSHLPSLAL